MLPKDFLATLHIKLVAERDALRADIAAGEDATHAVELDQSRVGRLSRMDAMQVQAMATANAARRTQRLIAIGAALRRLDDAEFGYCAACGEAIDTRRLEIDPTATQCISCAQHAED